MKNKKQKKELIGKVYGFKTVFFSESSRKKVKRIVYKHLEMAAAELNAHFSENKKGEETFCIKMSEKEIDEVTNNL
jgi:hypothetical protein